MDKLNSLIIFVRAAQDRSFSIAPRQLGLYPSAISKAVLRQLGAYLLNHTAIARSDLKPVLESYAPPGAPISVVYPQKRHLSAKVRAFVNFMSELMAQCRDRNGLRSQTISILVFCNASLMRVLRIAFWKE